MTSLFAALDVASGVRPSGTPSIIGKTGCSRSSAWIWPLLIDAEDESSVGRGKVKADDIAYLVDEQPIVRQLKRLATVWCKPNATHIRRIAVW
jgi:hypothetical protein